MIVLCHQYLVLQAKTNNQANAKGSLQRERGLTCVAEVRRAQPRFKSNSIIGEALQCRRTHYNVYSRTTYERGTHLKVLQNNSVVIE